jgi:hypothetical protein
MPHAEHSTFRVHILENCPEIRPQRNRKRQTKLPRRYPQNEAPRPIIARWERCAENVWWLFQ